MLTDGKAGFAGNVVLFEGPDDCVAVNNLLRRHDIEVVKKVNGQLQRRLFNEVMIACGGKTEIPPKLGNYLKNYNSTKRVLVIRDADDDPGAAWRSLHGVLSKHVLNLSDELPTMPWIGETSKRVNVGVWLMPGEGARGALEDFLISLIPQTSESLWKHAQDATADAQSKHNAPFLDKHLSKAKLVPFLGWNQVEPNGSYGAAISSNAIDTDAVPARAFVNWFCEFFEIEKPIV